MPFDVEEGSEVTEEEVVSLLYGGNFCLLFE